MIVAPYVMVFPNALSSDVCRSIIQKFEDDAKAARRPGKFGGGIGTVNLAVKNSTDLSLCDVMSDEDWRDIDTALYQSLSRHVDTYVSYINDAFHANLRNDTLFDRGYQIQKYDQCKGMYNYHNDALVYKDQSERLISFIWYLNTVNVGGETEFVNPVLRVKPQIGQLLLFPATWTFVHRGCVPQSSEKYIVTGWMCRPSMSI